MGVRLRGEIQEALTVSMEAGHSYTARQLTDMLSKAAIRRVVAGVYLGYSRKSILAFLQRADGDAGKSAKGTPFDGSGYIPSEDDLKRPVGEVVKDINKRRLAKEPFTVQKGKQANVDVSRDVLAKAISDNPEIIPSINGALGYIRVTDASLLK